MFKKIIKATNFSRQEKTVERYMKEVRDIEAAGVSRRDLFKMGLTAGVGGLAAIGGRNFLPNLAEAATTGIISPPCTKPWSEPLPIPGTAVSVANFAGPLGDKGQCSELHNIYNPGKGPRRCPCPPTRLPRRRRRLAFCPTASRAHSRASGGARRISRTTLPPTPSSTRPGTTRRASS